jgi:hypothetical protein
MMRLQCGSNSSALAHLGFAGSLSAQISVVISSQDAMIMGADYYESDKQQEELRAAG